MTNEVQALKDHRDFLLIEREGLVTSRNNLWHMVADLMVSAGTMDPDIEVLHRSTYPLEPDEATVQAAAAARARLEAAAV